MYPKKNNDKQLVNATTNTLHVKITPQNLYKT